ncbi:class I SAM-dependent methyltransferase [Candidatus Regiella insecticola]|uniref:Methyltransferase type 11 n=1 Tax=Candidatus Regiella insecticola TaxID=138073 RepID=A0A6L2ZMQ2_9ENTR|nr:class I SAM-dependent methyltransferase [Candidatus Regiella insecticola]GFN45660.1 methyltransferase type 11 [Candidatus Regiella insecticola]
MSDQGTEGLLSPYLRKKRIQAAAPHLKGRVLDFGCGSGALATLIEPDKYLGYEIDSDSIQQAQILYPKHCFTSELPESSNKFDTIVSLAVIEHISDPIEFLRILAAYLNETASSSQIVVTTPHPLFDWVHYLGAKIGLFSKSANEEHEDLLNRSKLEFVGKQARLMLISYRRFLFGANQIAIYTKGSK